MLRAHSVKFLLVICVWISVCVHGDGQEDRPRRVLVIGSTGTGKSTLINALVGQDVRDTSSMAQGCTASYASVTAEHRGTVYEFVDTVGLNEAEGGTVNKQQAIGMFFKFLRDNKEGFNLIIFCIRQERMTAESKATYEVMVKKLYSQTTVEAPPVLIVASGVFVGFKHPQEWCEENRQTFSSRGYSEAAFGDAFHCISLPPNDPDPDMEAILKKRRQDSTRRAWAAVEAHVVPTPRPYYKDLRGLLKLGQYLWNALVDISASLGLNALFGWTKVVPNELGSLIQSLGFTVEEFWEAVDL